MISDGVPTIKGIRLFKDGSCGKVTGISDKTKGLGVIRESQNWGRNEGLQQGSKGSLLVCWSGPHTKGVSFMVRLNRGCAIVE